MELTIGKIKETAKKFPNKPGVYFWRNEKGEPLYIGRAGSLKKRVASYFLTKDERIKELVQTAVSLDYQTTDTLLEAIVLEANLIKRYWPKYNVKDRDNRSFVYLVILSGAFPKPIIVRGRDLEKYPPSNTLGIFGPFQSYRLLKTALEIIRPIFPYSTCNSPKDSQSLKPCFHNQIGLCPGVCINKIESKEYKKSIHNLILFFRGEKKLLLKQLKKNNADKIKALQHVQDTALLAESNHVTGAGEIASRRIEGYDISHLSGTEPVGAMVVFENGEKDPSQYRLFKIKGVASNQVASSVKRNSDDLAMLEEVLERRLRHSEWPLPDILFIDGGVNQVKRAVQVLSRRHISIPVVGLAKGGKHAASAYATDKLVIANTKKIGKDLLINSKKLFQEVRNEAHRFAIGFQRKRTSRGFISKGWIR